MVAYEKAEKKKATSHPEVRAGRQAHAEMAESVGESWCNNRLEGMEDQIKRDGIEFAQRDLNKKMDSTGGHSSVKSEGPGADAKTLNYSPCESMEVRERSCAGRLVGDTSQREP